LNKNYEIKCKVANYKKLKNSINKIKNFAYSVEKQIDIYYKVNHGRLKLRIINDGKGALIFYEREEQTNKRISKYIISETNNFIQLDAILRKQFKVLISVQKKREVYIYRNIRIHLDYIKNLGRFLEIEIIYENLKNAKSQMKKIISKLNLNENDFIKESYSDLLITKSILLKN
jgi:adenylate cyclase class 2